ncbi:hypothetical protein THIOM_004608 [Candidatus Thiomargarita nelsonii]|uniref:Uncharacterized protein n=1 Tax=Candidatus Thiomargarita nelsonii TaxID=1003181 RepID=A0A176RVG7_9GAMM|nr:hypothetical protein THIOM_004608 [Candidatus Thiomargarita nelsonii]
MSLNELSNEPHNVWYACFASRKTVKKQAFKKLKQLGFVSIANELKWFISGLMRLWFGTGEEKMSIEFTPEEVTEFGKQLGDVWLADLTVDEVLARFEPKEVLSHFKPVDRLAGLKPEVIEDYLKQLKKQQD